MFIITDFPWMCSGSEGWMRISYPGFERQEDLGQKEDEAFQADGEILQDKVSDAHGPNQVEEVKAAEVGFGKYKAGRENRTTSRWSVIGESGVFPQGGWTMNSSKTNVKHEVKN